MKNKTQVIAPAGKQELFIERVFDLPVTHVFRAYTEPELVEQWMENRVLQMDCHPGGTYSFESRNAQGIVVFRAHGIFHQCEAPKTIIRTFEMENTGFPVQLEYLTFKELSADTSQLTIQIVFQSLEAREQLLKLPFASGINQAHNRLQQTVRG